MIYNPEDKKTWPEEYQHVMVWSPIEGRTLATFYLYDYRENGHPHFGNWFNKEISARKIYPETDKFPVKNPCEWWPLPELECMKPENLK